MGRLVLLVMLLSLCGGAHGQQNCPWLTQGTAASLMGGAVSASAHVANGEGSCDFAREDGSLRLRIAVSLQQPRECRTGEPVAGIGEDAVLCVEDAAGEHRESLRGRVRSTHFLLTMTARGSKDSLRSSLTQIGEEVAGNLF